MSSGDFTFLHSNDFIHSKQHGIAVDGDAVYVFKTYIYCVEEFQRFMIFKAIYCYLFCRGYEFSEKQVISHGRFHILLFFWDRAVK